MGGNALSFQTARLDKQRYDLLAAAAVDRLRASFPANRVHAIESYRSKADFGDLDVLIESIDYNPLRAADALGAVEVVRNGPVTSIGVLVDPAELAQDNNVFQVDLISMPSEAFEFAKRYFSNSDLSNLLGRVAHAQGLSLRHDGLVYHFRDGDYKFRETFLTRDYLSALPVLGYDPKRYAEGFEDLEEIFRYVASSPYFNRDIFLLENRNNTSRTRDRKRPTYNAFLKWCEERADLTAYRFPERKSDWLPHIVEHFPHFQAEYDQNMADLARQREQKVRFNGALVAQITGLEGKELGGLMKRIKESFAEGELQAFVLQASSTEIEEMVRRAQASGSRSRLQP